MDDIRELQRQKWLKSQEAKAEDAKNQAASSASISASIASGSGDASPYAAASAPVANLAPNATGSSSLQAAAPVLPPAASDRESTAAPLQKGELNPIRRLHILPIGPSADSSGQARLQLLSPELRRLRTEEIRVCSGLFLKSGDHEFVIVKADPDQGLLAADTDFFVDGDFVLRFDKVQFMCLKDFNVPTAETEDATALFSDYISPYFKSIADSEQGVGNVITIGDSVNIRDKDFKVVAAEPASCEIGIIDVNTMVFVDWDSTVEFEKIHIVPFQDTLPGAYEFDVFNDYIKPYLSRNKYIVLNTNDQFTYQGVQFKVVCCEPNGPGRIGRNTTIYCDGQLHPSLRNLLPPELLAQLQDLPPGLQMLLMNTEALAGGYEERLIEVQEMLSRRRGLANETIDQVVKFKWGEEGAPACSSNNSQAQCMVCLSDFADGEDVRRLPCGHVFHAPCIDEWLRRCTDCPICKANVDRAVRDY